MKQNKGQEREEREKLELLRMEKEMVLLKKKSKSLLDSGDLGDLIEEEVVLHQIAELNKSMNEIRYNIDYGE